MKGSPIAPRPVAKAAHPHPAGLLRKAITKRQSGVGRTFQLLSTGYIKYLNKPKLCLQINRNNIKDIFKLFQAFNVSLLNMIIDRQHHDCIAANSGPANLHRCDVDVFDC